jgi:hypothetical protein
MKTRCKRTLDIFAPQLHQANKYYAAALQADLAFATYPMTGRSRTCYGLSAQTKRGRPTARK